MITVWVNAYYGNLDLGGDVFETVNPSRRPREELIIKEARSKSESATQAALYCLGRRVARLPTGF